MTTHRSRFWHLARAVVEGHCRLAAQQHSGFHSTSISSFFLLLSPWHFFFFQQLFGSSHISTFHSPVHDGSVDVDEIDEDFSVEDALGDDNDEDDEARLRLVATK